MILGLTLIHILLFIGIMLFFLLAAAAPFETLGWWAGWFGGQADDEEPLSSPSPAETISPDADIKHYVVYLAGINDVSGDTLSPIEVEMLERIEARLPWVKIVHDIFPYSPTNTALIGNQRLFAQFWIWLFNLRITKDSAIAFLINVRNLMQVAVISDSRYGPFYSRGSAEIIRNSLLRHGYVVGSGQPLTLIGFSGGGSIALGAAKFLRQMLKAPVQVISLAGVLCSDPSLKYIDHLYHLYGAKDSVQNFGAYLFPSRWSIFANSDWNQALAAGRLKLVCMGPMIHVDPGGYFDKDSYLADNGSHADVTFNHFVYIIEEFQTEIEVEH